VTLDRSTGKHCGKQVTRNIDVSNRVTGNILGAGIGRKIAIASTNDPFATLERAKAFAAAWGSELVILESAGHINAASGYGPWPQGEGLLDQLMQ
jgi:predicted alpha/beta hydrolase family esterase